MRLTSVLVILVLARFGALAQVQKTSTEKNIEFLKDILTYSYQNSSDGTWWVNRFSFDETEDRAHFRTASAENPLVVIDKRRVDRSFKFSDLDPYAITVEETENNMGLIVEGKLISIPTVKGLPLIAKNLNGQGGTPQMVLLISIPAYMEQEINLSGMIVEAFKEVIFDATDIENLYHSRKNQELIFNTLVGDHISGEVHRYTRRKSRFELTYEEYKDRQKTLDGRLLYDYNTDDYTEVVTKNQSASNSYSYKVDSTRQELVLVESGESSSRSIEFVNRSLFRCTIDGEVMEYRPESSFVTRSDEPKSR